MSRQSPLLTPSRRPSQSTAAFLSRSSLIRTQERKRELPLSSLVTPPLPPLWSSCVSFWSTVCTCGLTLPSPRKRMVRFRILFFSLFSFFLFLFFSSFLSHLFILPCSPGELQVREFCAKVGTPRGRPEGLQEGRGSGEGPLHEPKHRHQL